jgi:preprotein translocase subunit SecG
MTVVLVLIERSIGSAIAAIYMHTHQQIVKWNSSGSFPSFISYDLIFLTVALILTTSIALMIVLKKVPDPRSKKSKIEGSNKQVDVGRSSNNWQEYKAQVFLGDIVCCIIFVRLVF